MKKVQTIPSWGSLNITMNLKTACIVLGVKNPQPVRQMLKKGIIKGNKVGRAWCIDRDKLYEYINGEAMK